MVRRSSDATLSLSLFTYSHFHHTRLALKITTKINREIPIALLSSVCAIHDVTVRALSRETSEISRIALNEAENGNVSITIVEVGRRVGSFQIVKWAIEGKLRSWLCYVSDWKDESHQLLDCWLWIASNLIHHWDEITLGFHSKANFRGKCFPFFLLFCSLSREVFLLNS